MKKLIIAGVLINLLAVVAFAESTEFTYQGRLLDNSFPPTAIYDFQFSLWDSLASGTQQGTTQAITGVAVSNGIFTVRLDFGANFPGAARFLEINVRQAGGGAYTPLTPRQPLTSTPYAIRSANAATADTATTATTTLRSILLGSLRWDLLLPQNFAVGTTPFGVAFDGANIWVANRDSNNVTKLRASDGALQGTFAVGSSPQGLSFDGANIWVANLGSNNVTKLRASDGALQGTFAVGSSPQGLTFDGANIWVANLGSANVTKLRASDGALQGTFAVGSSPTGVAFDGANIWAANSGVSNVTKLRASDGACRRRRWPANSRLHFCGRQ